MTAAPAPVRPADVEEVPAPILIVDDRPDSLHALSAVLEPLGQPILTARSGDEALRHLLKEDVAVILLDVNMPGLDGFSTASLIKRRRRTRDVPIIFMTAERDATDRGDVQLGYSSGAVDFIVKPFDPWALVSKVGVFVTLHRTTAQLRRQVVELEASRAALSNAQRMAHLAHFTIDALTGQVQWSSDARSLFGIGPEQANPSSRFPFWQQVLDPPHAGDSKQLQATIVRPDGSAAMVIALVEYKRARNGEVVEITGTVQDVTEQEQTRRALAAANDALERESASVAMLQEAMLPMALPSAPALDVAARYLPAEVGVGGDWYDASLRLDGQVLLAIGDVAGHGLRAAHAMNEIRIASRAFSLRESSPSRLLQHLNEFSQAAGRREFVTALMVLLDPVTGAGVAASAGHLPPLLVDDDGARFLDLVASPPLGISASRAHETPFQLPPGGRLVLFTDGLVEERRRDLDERLAELLEVVEHATGSANELVDALVGRLLPEGRPADDVAVLAIVRALDDALRIRVPATTNHLAPIRAMLRRWLVANGAAEDEVMELVLAVGELTSNVCSHAHPMEDGPMTIEARVVDGAVQASISDEGTWRPTQDRGGGRGLEIVRAVVDDVSIERRDDGTTVRIVRGLRQPGMTTEGAHG